MPPADDADPGPRRRPPGLPVRVLRVVSSDGIEVAEETVYCPRRDTSLAIDVCTSCAHFRGVHLESRGQSEVGCTEALASAPASARLTPVSEVMTRQVVAVHEDAPAGRVRAVLLERSAGYVPVVDAESRPIGMITLESMLRRRRLRGEIPRAKALMVPTTLAIPEGTSISQASAIMAQEERKALPVISPERRVVGLVTALDVLAWLARHEGYLVTNAG